MSEGPVKAVEIVGSVADGLAREDEAFAAPGTHIRLWTARRRAVVCPRNLSRKPGFDAAARASACRGWPVFLRPTGGGAVPQGPGVLNLALAFTVGTAFTIDDGYRLLTEVIRDAISKDLTAGATPNSFCDGTWNLSLGGQKVVGTAQRIRPLGGGQRRVLAHALILVEGDVAVGAGAIDALHNGLGLPPILAQVHRTLGPSAPPFDDLAAALSTQAQRHLHGVVPRGPFDIATGCKIGEKRGIRRRSEAVC